MDSNQFQKTNWTMNEFLDNILGLEKGERKKAFMI